MASPATGERSVLEVTLLFARLGLTSFGGPAAHIALFRDEFVRRRAWLGDRDFLDLLSAANLIPGPTSTELAMHVGYRRAGWPGLFAAGLAFLLPAAVIVGGLAWAYVELGTLPAFGAVLVGIAPVVVAIVAHATVALGQASIKAPWTAVVGAVALVASLLGVPPIVVLLSGGAVGVARLGLARLGPAGRAGAAAVVALPLGGAAALAGAGGFGLLGLAVAFARMGVLLFGSGYLLVALLEDELVTGAGLITRRELLDAVAVGQLTPGPVITTATFVGYLLLGLPGAIVATAAITVPAFAFVALSVPVLARLRKSRAARAALDGIAAAVVGALIAVTAELAGAAIVDVPTALLAAAAFGAMLTGRVNAVWLIALGAAAGAAAELAGVRMGR